MQSAECVSASRPYCLLPHHLPACCFCQQREVSERRHQTLSSLLLHVLASMEIFTECFIFGCKGFGHLGISYGFQSSIPFTIPVKG